MDDEGGGTTGDIKSVRLQSNHIHQQSTPSFTARCPCCHSTNSDKPLYFAMWTAVKSKGHKHGSRVTLQNFREVKYDGKFVIVFMQMTQPVLVLVLGSCLHRWFSTLVLYRVTIF